MSRYVIEIKPEYEDKFRGIMILGAENSNLYVDSVAVDELEELNSDYINKHFGDLQDTAYQRGLNDAWKRDCYIHVRKRRCVLRYDARRVSGHELEKREHRQDRQTLRHRINTGGYAS